MKVTMLLADAVQEVGGKLYILGGGWSVIGPAPIPFGIAIKVEVPWNQANRRHTWELKVFDADGQPAVIPPDSDDGELVVAGDFEVGRPPGLLEGTAMDLPIAVNFGPVEFAPQTRYEWRLSIDGHSDDGWRLAFTTR